MADDEPDTLEIMVKRVKAAGYDVVSAHDGEEAWNKIVSEGIASKLALPILSALSG